MSNIVTLTHPTFFVNSALKVDQLSIFNNEDRYFQTVQTIESIKLYFPHAHIHIFDSSPSLPDEDKIFSLNRKGIENFIYCGDIPVVQEFSLAGQRSLAETYAFICFLDQYMKNYNCKGMIYKLSGRYQLSQDFDPIFSEFKSIGKFTFAKSIESWMTPEQQNKTGMRRLYKLRLWYMDSVYLPSFKEDLSNIFHDCASFGVDVEHAYYKHLSKYVTVEKEKIGVKGIIAPSGEEIDE